MSKQLKNRLFLYQLTAVFSVIFALTGFSYNVWRMEISENNNNVRIACFEMLKELASLEQIIYSAAYDNDLDAGSPRKAWVKVGLVNDLSMLTSPGVEAEAARLGQTWADSWESMIESETDREKIIQSIDDVRTAIKTLLSSLE